MIEKDQYGPFFGKYLYLHDVKGCLEKNVENAQPIEPIGERRALQHARDELQGIGKTKFP